jgi:hypothetical protein
MLNEINKNFNSITSILWPKVKMIFGTSVAR